MQTLTIERPVPFVVGDAPLLIALVGCGGTGSHLAQSLARIAAHLRGRQQVQLVFVDGDVVEPKNVGRQLFAAGEVGQNKAQTLAARFNALFGLDIVAIPFMATHGGILYSPNELHRRNSALPRRVLVGAVDNADARKVLHDALGSIHGWRLWIDSGNHESAGQVVVGTATRREQLRDAIALGGGLCSELPAASLIYPELLAPATAEPALDCAAAMQNDAQSLMVNQMMASIAAQYLYQIVVQRRITTFRSVVDLDSLNMRSTPITAPALAAAVGMSEAEVTGEIRQSSRRGA